MSRGFVLDEHEDGLVLAGPGTTAHVAVAESEPAAVRRAVADPGGRGLESEPACVRTRKQGKLTSYGVAPSPPVPPSGGCGLPWTGGVHRS